MGMVEWAINSFIFLAYFFTVFGMVNQGRSCSSVKNVYQILINDISGNVSVTLVLQVVGHVWWFRHFHVITRGKKRIDWGA
ncbi:hypothetical protein QBC42DRAFT_271233 [Cladorrhinum samala]|uniref:Uncharacterized protein n=1 Tax=Cladorrhinum samala TaxID=585594 RepID=A0AAV9HNG0_9PEZI|nr:hypothetical protein QBC42DRAFT_271233 [Cladorrhinum samala]